jgi:hypothetical protein
MYHDFPSAKTAASMAAAKQICAECGGKLRYEVRPQDGKWIVWDTVVDDCAMKSVVGAVDGLRSIIASNNARYMLNGRLLVPTPNSVAFDTRPAMFWTQEEAQQWADTRNDIDQSGTV